MSSATAASLRLPAPVVPSRASLRPRRANSAVRTFACHDAKVVRVSARETCGEVVAWLGKTACAVGLCLTLTAGGEESD